MLLASGSVPRLIPGFERGGPIMTSDEVLDLEARYRRTDLLVDDEAVVGFFDQRIPAEIVSVRHFDRWWKEARLEDPHRLDLTAEDLLDPGIDMPGEEAFPEIGEEVVVCGGGNGHRSAKGRLAEVAGFEHGAIVEELGGGALRPGQGTLSGCLHELEDALVGAPAVEEVAGHVPELDLEAIAHRTPRASTQTLPRLEDEGVAWAEEILAKTFEETEGYDEMVTLRGIRLESHCEHHLVPFLGQAHVAYLPDNKIIGLSKIARIVDVFARRLQVQERLTNQIGEALEDVLRPHGVAVVLSGQRALLTIWLSCRTTLLPLAKMQCVALLSLVLLRMPAEMQEASTVLKYSLKRLPLALTVTPNSSALLSWIAWFSLTSIWLS